MSWARPCRDHPTRFGDFLDDARRELAAIAPGRLAGGVVLGVVRGRGRPGAARAGSGWRVLPGLPDAGLLRRPRVIAGAEVLGVAIRLIGRRSIADVLSVDPKLEAAIFTGRILSMPPQKMHVRLATALVTLSAVAALLAGCGGSSDPINGGPISFRSGGSDCQTVHHGQPVTFGDEQYQNHGDSTVVLESVSLLHPQGLKLLGADVIPGEDGIGETIGWPPPGSVLWKKHVPVHGFRLPVHKVFEMLLGTVAVTKPVGKASGTIIRYRDASHQYVLRNHLAMLITTNGHDCS